MYKPLSIYALAILTVITFSCQQKTSSSDKTSNTEEVAVEEEPSGFDKALTFGDKYSFGITATDEGSTNTLVIETNGYSIASEPYTHDFDGKVYDAEVADLNGDGFPEVLVYITGSDGYGSLIAYSSNKDKSMSQAFLADIKEDEAASQGYGGTDAFSVYEGKLTRRFPIIDEAGNSTGFNRQITYKLVDGEASRHLEVEKVIKYKAG